jgi:hypothetical protein
VIEKDTVREQFAGLFTQAAYDGSYHDSREIRTDASEEASRSFCELTGGILVNWCQVHGDVKDVVKRAAFEPYPYWTELYDCCKRIVQAHADLDRQFLGDLTRARIMGDAMSLLRSKYKHDAPRWWFPIMKTLRNREVE